MTTTIAQYIDKTAPRFKEVGTDLKFGSEKGFALSLLANNSWLNKVATENPASLMQAVASVASIGLSLNPAEKQAYLITRNVKTGNNQWEQRVCLEPSYIGLCKLATDSGAIEWVQADIAYEQDTFTHNGIGSLPSHQYNAFSKDRGDVVGVYCVAKTKSGDYLTEVMPLSEIHSIRDRSEAWKKGQNGPWKTDFNEMAKKAVTRRAYKRWPRSTGSRFAEAVNISNENEGFEPIVTSPEVGQFTTEQKAYYDQMIEQSDALGMYTFIEGLRAENEGAVTALYHSFGKGEKGKYQRIVDGLNRSGFDMVQSYVDLIATFEDDAVIEAISELTEDQMNIVKARLNSEQDAYLRELSKAA